MKEAICEKNFESPDLMKFSVGMRDLILQQAPPHQAWGGAGIGHAQGCKVGTLQNRDGCYAAGSRTVYFLGLWWQRGELLVPMAGSPWGALGRQMRGLNPSSAFCPVRSVRNSWQLNPGSCGRWFPGPGFVTGDGTKSIPFSCPDPRHCPPPARMAGALPAAAMPGLQ